MFSYSDYYLGILRRYSARPPEDLDVLDYGCGAGWLAHGLREKGCRARGYDLVNRLEKEAADALQYYDFFYPDKNKVSTFDIEWDRFRLPYADGSFDVLITSQVIEHLMRLEPVMAEFARVLRPDGVAIHTFPTGWRIMEAHIHVPFGWHLQSEGYYAAMDALGFRRRKLDHLSRAERVKEELNIVRNQVVYRHTGDILAMARRYFHRAGMDYEAYCRTDFTTEWQRLWHAARCNLFKSVMMVTQFPHR